jgi:hypothetical protein
MREPAGKPRPSAAQGVDVKKRNEQRSAAPNSQDRIQDKSQVQVIARAAAILRALEQQPAGLSLGQIAQRVELARSTVQRIVAALAAEKLLIAASPTGRVRLGPTILRLAASARTDFVAIARPFLVRLSNELGETVDLATIRKDHLIFVDQVIGPQRLRTVSAVGETFPLLHGQRQGLSGAARRGRDRPPDRHQLRAAHRQHHHAAQRAAQGAQGGSQVGRGVRRRGAYARHLRGRRGAARSRRQRPSDLGAGAGAALPSAPEADRRAADRHPARVGAASRGRGGVTQLISTV